VDSLIDELLRNAGHRKHALHSAKQSLNSTVRSGGQDLFQVKQERGSKERRGIPVDVVALQLKQLRNPRVRLIHVELTRLVETDGADAIVVLMLTIHIEEGWVHVKHTC